MNDIIQTWMMIIFGLFIKIGYFVCFYTRFPIQNRQKLIYIADKMDVGDKMYTQHHTQNVKVFIMVLVILQYICVMLTSKK